jgi:peptidoglycan/LPS O-acetylase OafA/YrhL
VGIEGADIGGTAVGRESPTRAVGSTARFPCFDGLRAIAALSILVLHFAGYSGLVSERGFGGIRWFNTGVAVFFVISGFLLYRPFAVAHLDGMAAPRYGDFVRRRLLRLVPAYWAILLILWVTHEIPRVNGWGALTYFGFVHIYFPRYAIGGLIQSWSLCTELAFYLLLPAYAGLIARHRRPARTQLRVELTGLAVLYAGSFAFMGFIRLVDLWPSVPVQVWLPGKLSLFASGMLLAVSSAWFAARPTPRVEAIGRPRAAVASWAIAGVFFYLLATRVSPDLELLGGMVGSEFFEGLIAFFLVLPAVFGGNEGGVVRALLRSRPLQFAGLVSYGIYLWHVEVVSLVLRAAGGTVGFIRYTFPDGRPPYVLMFVPVVAITLAFATLSYYLVERRFLRLKHRGLLPAVARRPAMRGLSSADGPARAASSPNGDRAEPDARAGLVDRGS